MQPAQFKICQHCRQDINHANLYLHQMKCQRRRCPDKAESGITAGGTSKPRRGNASERRSIGASIGQLSKQTDRPTLPGSRIMCPESRPLNLVIDHHKDQSYDRVHPKTRDSVQDTSSKGRPRIFRSETETETFACMNCGYPKSLSDLDTHPLVCPNRNEACVDCGQIFPKGLMGEHRQECHNLRPAQSIEQHRRIARENLGHPQLYQRRLLFGGVGQISPRNQPQRIYEFNQGIGFRPQQVFLNFEEEWDEPFMFLISSFMSSTGDAPNLRMAGMTKKEIEKLSKAKYECKGEGEKCSICYCDFEEAENITILWCKHNYHSECIGKWLSLNSHCPLCKQSAKNVL